MSKILAAFAIAAALLTGPAMAKTPVAKHAVKATTHHAHVLKKTAALKKHHRHHKMAKHAMRPMHGGSLPANTTKGGGGN